ncbi:MAG: aspartate ammonia-lyase [Oligoflexia bacterium]|nr:aspartate ammonia-lyase [Oligoflexia bacterium]
MGPVEVPTAAFWGAQTARALRNFPVSGRQADPSLHRAFLRIKRAAAVANRIAGSLGKTDAFLIIQAIDELLAMPEPEWRSLFPVDIFQAGAGTSQNMNVNEVIANVANRLAGNPLGAYVPIHPNDHVNQSQSTNDVFPSAMRLALLDSSRPLLRALRELASALDRKGDLWRELPKSARTHLQDAVPMRLGEEFLAYGRTLARCADRLELARDELRELGLGGSAAGTGLNVPRGYIPTALSELSRLTGERLRSAPSLYESMQSQAPVGFYSSMLRLTGLELTRICNDLRLLASGPLTGLAELLLPSVQPGSSIMPGKVNPSIVEMCNQAWFAVLGHDHTAAMALQAGQLELNVMMPVMAHAMLEATRVATNATELLRVRCIEGLRANEPRLRRYFESTPQIATALSPRLGYAAVAKLVHEAETGGSSVLELVRARGIMGEAELARLIEPGRLTGALRTRRPRTAPSRARRAGPARR